MVRLPCGPRPWQGGSGRAPFSSPLRAAGSGPSRKTARQSKEACLGRLRRRGPLSSRVHQASCRGVKIAAPIENTFYLPQTHSIYREKTFSRTEKKTDPSTKRQAVAAMTAALIKNTFYLQRTPSIYREHIHAVAAMTAAPTPDPSSDSCSLMWSASSPKMSRMQASMRALKLV